jgi:hypothetical protein
MEARGVRSSVPVWELTAVHGRAQAIFPAPIDCSVADPPIVESLNVS